MRPPKEIVVLLVLLLVSMASILLYVHNRRARMHDAPPRAARPMGPVRPAIPADTAAPAPAHSQPAPSSQTAGLAPDRPVDLTKHDGQTLDFSSGHPVVKQTAADKAALDAGLKDIADATKGVTFGPPPMPAEPPPAPGKP